jgi:hypothetical protein
VNSKLQQFSRVTQGPKLREVTFCHVSLWSSKELGKLCRVYYIQPLSRSDIYHCRSHFIERKSRLCLHSKWQEAMPKERTRIAVKDHILLLTRCSNNHRKKTLSRAENTPGVLPSGGEHWQNTRLSFWVSRNILFDLSLEKAISYQELAAFP